ncbi:uncharacterized protein K441DRAFT_659464 [Cenococcum geophilum 1.58]|uniref:uncharacterized protein n=1 Tax=Cenococcum geophilum 1.58 TaxID=794803 RepID=UPI00358EF964|nr:hypothetical protein K441DRAFT_659464 [Cenococcum geophilum 1.58]
MSIDLRKWQLKERLGRKWFGWPKKKGKAGKHEGIVLRLSSERSASGAAGDEEPSVPRGTGLRKLE